MHEIEHIKNITDYMKEKGVSQFVVKSDTIVIEVIFNQSIADVSDSAIDLPDQSTTDEEKEETLFASAI